MLDGHHLAGRGLPLQARSHGGHQGLAKLVVLLRQRVAEGSVGHEAVSPVIFRGKDKTISGDRSYYQAYIN